MRDSAPRALVADIGATNARFATAAPDGTLSPVMTLACREFPGLAAAVRAYRDASGLDGQGEAAIALAGPVGADRVALTNTHWRFSVEEARAELGLERLLVLNDFAALARSLPALDRAAEVQVGGAAPVADGVRALIGPGTGLGVATLVPVRDGWIALAGEGGYVSLSPLTDQEVALWRIIRARHGRVSAERILSGPGLIELYSAVCEARGRQAVLGSSEAITARAADRSCADCVETLALFCGFLGDVAGDLALTVGARGGVYIGGGIVPGIRGLLEASQFRSRFDAKGRMSAFVTAVPVFVITAPAPALLGCLAVLRDGAGSSRECVAAHAAP